MIVTENYHGSNTVFLVGVLMSVVGGVFIVFALMALCYRSVVVHKNYSLCLRLVCRNIHVENSFVCVYIYVYICTYICMCFLLFFFFFFTIYIRRTYIFTCISFRIRTITVYFSFTLIYCSFRIFSTFFFFFFFLF